MKNLLSIGMQNTLTYFCKNHSHNCWEVTLYVEGEGINVTAGKDIYFKKGTIICQPPDLEHKDISKNGYKNIFFCVENFPFSAQNPLVFNDTPNFDFYNIVKQMYYEFHHRLEHKLITDALLNVLLQYLIILADSTDKSYLVECFKRELVNNLSNPFYDITASVKSLPVCPDHFRRIFKEDTGKTPVQYLLEIRIAYAKDLLQNSTLSVKNIAQMCGFDDPYYFSRIFKKNTNMSPSKYATTIKSN